MKNLNLFTLLGISVTTLALAGCSSSSSSDNGGDGGTPDGTTSDGPVTGDDGPATGDSPSTTDGPSTTDAKADGASPPPPPPALGTQIDRLGRPAVNTALNHVFDTNSMTKGMAKDAYNQDSVPADWGANVPEFFKNLAIFDSLDTVCGNQPAYNGFTYPAYTALAGVLANDALWLNTGSTTCTTYLAVELNLLGVSNTDCGGRTPLYNTIDVTYNLVAGTYTPTTDGGAPGPVSNGVTAPASPPTTTFPYFAAPH